MTSVLAGSDCLILRFTRFVTYDNQEVLRYEVPIEYGIGWGWKMKKKDINYFKEYLTDKLEELLSQADDTVSDMTDANDNFPDPTDRASLEADRNFMLRIRDREHKLIKKIRSALERIDSDTFGMCESCGEDISIQRLKARPVTTQCIDCKTKEEALEKALGI